MGEARSPTHPRFGVEQDLRELMVLGLDGDATAYRHLLAKLSQHLRNYFSRRLTATDVEDLVQETLLAVHLKRESYDRSLPFTPWAYALARYKLVDHFRHQPTSHLPIDVATDMIPLESPDAHVVDADLAQLLKRLPARQRTLIEDVKLQGLSVEEAARRRGVSAASARVMLHRSLKRLTQAVHLEGH